MVLEQRQAGAGLNPTHPQQVTSEETILASIPSPMHGTEMPQQHAEVDTDSFQQDFDETDLNEQANQTATQPAIKKTDKTQGRHKPDFRNKGDEVAVQQSNVLRKPSPKIQDQEEQKQTNNGEACRTKPAMMTRAQLYAALPDKTGSDPRINPNKDKFFFGSALRIYGGTRWSELRKRAQNEIVAVTASNEFELEEDNERESKRKRPCEASIFDEKHNTLAEEDFDNSIAMENQTFDCQLSEINVYQGNWKASAPAFIVITNSLFTLDDY